MEEEDEDDEEDVAAAAAAADDNEEQYIEGKHRKVQLCRKVQLFLSLSRYVGFSGLTRLCWLAAYRQAQSWYLTGP